MSFPCMNKKKGAAGKNTIPAATIPPVMAPVCPAAFHFFHRAQRSLLAVEQFHVVNVDVELSSARHPPLGLCFCHRSQSPSAFGDDQRSIQGDIFDYIEVDGISRMRIGRGEVPVEAKFDGRAIFQHKPFGGGVVRGLRWRRRRWSLWLRGGLIGGCGLSDCDVGADGQSWFADLRR